MLQTEVTCVLSRPGDLGARTHLMFGVGRGVVFRVRRADWVWEEVFSPAGLQTVPESSTLPADPQALRVALVDTRPGDLLVLATAGTARWLRRREVRAELADGWGRATPHPVELLAHLHLQVPGEDGDRALVGLWEASGH